MTTANSKVWLITGCSTGFGCALAKTVLANGHRLIASSRNPSKTPELVDEVTQAGGHWIPLDVTSKDLEQRIKEAEEIYGQLDVVVNNAGYSVVGAFEELALENIKSQMETNFFGPCRIMKAVLPGMRARKSGTIVNVSSTAGLRALPSFNVYASSKFAIEAVTESLAAEVVGFGIRVLLVEPGSFRTNFLSQGAVTYQEVTEAYRDTPVDKMIQSLHLADGSQAGDPVKGAQRIFEVVTQTGMASDKEQRLRLPLGSDCIRAARLKLDQLRENFDEFEDIACSTDST